MSLGPSKISSLSAVLMGAAVVAMSGQASATVLTGTLTADNGFFAYISTSPSTEGTLIGSGGNWQQAFSLTQTALTPGQTYYLNIEAINWGGPGGFSAVLNLSDSGFEFANGSQVLTTDPANLAAWTGSYNNRNSAFTAQPWVPATGTVVRALTHGWGNVVGTANWEWPGDSSSGGSNNTCGYCTVDFTTVITSAASTPVPEPVTWSLLLTGLVALGGVRRARRQSAFCPAESIRSCNSPARPGAIVCLN